MSVNQRIKALTVGEAFHLIQDCIREGNIVWGRALYALIKKNELHYNAFLGTHLIRMFASFRSLVDANQVFEILPEPSVFSWSAIIAAYADLEEGSVSTRRSNGNTTSSTSGRGSGSSQGNFSGSNSCDYSVRCNNGGSDSCSSGFGDRIGIGNRGDSSGESACVSSNAIRLYQKLRLSSTIEPDGHVHIAVLKACANSEDLFHGELLHHTLVETVAESERYVVNTLIDMYGKCGQLKDARSVFDRFQHRNVITWTCMIACYAQHQKGPEAIELFQKMHEARVESNKVTFVNILKACSTLAAWNQGRKVHIAIVEGGFHLDLFVGSALVDMYGKCGAIHDAYRVFSTISKRDVVMWNAMISTCSYYGSPDDVFSLYQSMLEEGILPDAITFTSIIKACTSLLSPNHGRSIHLCICRYGLDKEILVGNSLIDMYMSCKCVVDAFQVFELMLLRDVVTWSSLIAGCAEQGWIEDTLQLFFCMQKDGIEPNEVTYLSIVKACSNPASFDLGKLIHGCIIESGHDVDQCIKSSLIEMHSKCGRFEDASNIFDRGETKDVVAYGTMLAACAQNRDFESAIHYFEAMKHNSLSPDAEVFVCLLSACSKKGLMEYGFNLFGSIRGVCDLMPSVYVYNCMIDLLARAGCLVEAMDLTLSLPFDSNVFGWTSLLEHCKTHGHARLGKDCFKSLLGMEGDEAGPFVAMARILTSVENMEGFQRYTR